MDVSLHAWNHPKVRRALAWWVCALTLPPCSLCSEHIAWPLGLSSHLLQERTGSQYLPLWEVQHLAQVMA